MILYFANGRLQLQFSYLYSLKEERIISNSDYCSCDRLKIN